MHLLLYSVFVLICRRNMSRNSWHARTHPFRSLSVSVLALSPGRATAPSPPAAATHQGEKSEMGCGGGEGGMGSSFTWLDSVNSTMDEVKTIIVNEKVT